MNAIKTPITEIRSRRTSVSRSGPGSRYLTRRCLLPGLAGAIALAASGASWAQCSGDFSEELTLDWNSISPALTAGSNYSGSADHRRLAGRRHGRNQHHQHRDLEWLRNGRRRWPARAGRRKPGARRHLRSQQRADHRRAHLRERQRRSPARREHRAHGLRHRSLSDLHFRIYHRQLSGSGDDFRWYLDTRGWLDGNRRRHLDGHRPGGQHGRLALRRAEHQQRLQRGGEHGNGVCRNQLHAHLPERAVECDQSIPGDRAHRRHLLRGSGHGAGDHRQRRPAPGGRRPGGRLDHHHGAGQRRLPRARRPGGRLGAAQRGPDPLAGGRCRRAALVLRALPRRDHRPHSDRGRRHPRADPAPRPVRGRQAARGRPRGATGGPGRHSRRERGAGGDRAHASDGVFAGDCRPVPVPVRTPRGCP